MNVKFACVLNSVLGMRAHAKLETGHVTEMSGCPSLALLASSCRFFEISTCMSCFKCQTSRLIELIQVLLISKALVLRAEMSWLFFRSFDKKSKLFEVSTFEDGEDLAAVVAASSPACFDFQSKNAWHDQLKRCCRHFLVRSIEPFLLQLHCAKFLWYWMDRAIWSFFPVDCSSCFKLSNLEFSSSLPSSFRIADKIWALENERAFEYLRAHA